MLYYFLLDMPTSGSGSKVNIVVAVVVSSIVIIFCLFIIIIGIIVYLKSQRVYNVRCKTDELNNDSREGQSTV